MLRHNGIYVAIGGLVPILQALLLGRAPFNAWRKKMTFFIAKINQTDLVFLKSLLQAGKIVRSSTDVSA